MAIKPTKYSGRNWDMTYLSIHPTNELNFQEFPPYFRETFQWIQHAIMGKFKEIDKTVCPMAYYSHIMDSMFLGSLDASHGDRTRFIEDIRCLMGVFEDLKGRPNRNPVSLSLGSVQK